MMVYFHDDIYLQAQSQVDLSAVISYALRNVVPVKWIGREYIHAYICLCIMSIYTLVLMNTKYEIEYIFNFMVCTYIMHSMHPY